jgi:hypothetical protein
MDGQRATLAVQAQGCCLPCFSGGQIRDEDDAFSIPICSKQTAELALQVCVSLADTSCGPRRLSLLSTLQRTRSLHQLASKHEFAPMR